ncbi:MAG: hypothetical protein ACO3XP_09800 [Ilumatobacteraceae bacterium]
MTTNNDLTKLDRLINQGYGASQSAEDDYFDQQDERHELAIQFPVGQRFTRTTIHHYQSGIVIKTEPIINNIKRDSVVHIYHTGGK